MVANGQLNMFESDTPAPVLPLPEGRACTTPQLRPAGGLCHTWQRGPISRHENNSIHLPRILFSPRGHRPRCFPAEARGSYHRFSLSLRDVGRGCVMVGHVVFEHAVDEQGELTSGRRHGGGLGSGRPRAAGAGVAGPARRGPPPRQFLTLAPHRSGRAGSAASGSSTDGFATRRRVPAGPGSQAMATDGSPSPRLIWPVRLSVVVPGGTSRRHWPRPDPPQHLS